MIQCIVDVFHCMHKFCFSETYPEADLSSLSEMFSAMAKEVFRELIFSRNLRYVKIL